jgi:uncharacterized protein YndB with AHSA1/START domain
MPDANHLNARAHRSFTAPAERVFDAWLDSDLIGRWMFGPALRDEEVLRISIDPRVGGSFSFLVRRAGQELDHVGKYLEISRPHRLSFTWGIGEEAGDSSVVSIEIHPTHDGCELTLAHRLHPDWADYIARTEAAWTKMLNALAALIQQD